MTVAFVDTPEKTLYTAGWSPRIRKVQGKAGFELTYKKRYTIAGNDAADTADINAALDVANKDGFGGGRDSKYEAQVEWGYERMTLSISRDKKVAQAQGQVEIGSVGSASLPDEAQKIAEMLVKEAPDKFDDDGGVKGFGTTALKKGRVFGPVYAKRWVGTLEGVKMTLEVWPIKLKNGDEEEKWEYVTEMSFKADERKEGAKIRKRVTELLEEKGWLVPRDSLKTKLVMDNM